MESLHKKALIKKVTFDLSSDSEEEFGETGSIGSFGETDSSSDDERVREYTGINNHHLFSQKPDPSDYQINTEGIISKLAENLDNCDHIIIDGERYDLPNGFCKLGDIFNDKSDLPKTKANKSMKTKTMDWINIENFEQPKEFIFSERSGPNIELIQDIHGQAQYTPFSIFSLFLDEDLLKLFCCETNIYRNQYFRERENSSNFKQIDLNEIKKYIGIVLLMGIHSESAIRDYWSKLNIFKTKFGKWMSRNRFQLIHRFFHIMNNDHDTKQDLLYKIRGFIDTINEKFQKFFYPKKNLNIDEGMIKFDGRLRFKQYIANKPIKWGIKIFELCCSETCYCFRFLNYTGRKQNSEDGLVSVRVVKELMQPYLNKGHHLYMDNFYTSIRLVEELAGLNTGVCGTIRENRLLGKVEYPRIKNQSKHYTDERSSLLLTVWKDKQIVTIISNIHSSKFLKIEKTFDNTPIPTKKMIPKCVDDYNKLSRGVDRCNQISHHYRFPHRSRKWWRQIFFHLLHMIVSNSRIIYATLTQKNLGHKEFIIDIIHNLLDEDNTELLKKKKKNLKHLPKLINNISKNDQRLRCKFRGCDKKTKWYCEDCSDDTWICSLCLGERDCYHEYHNN